MNPLEVLQESVEVSRLRVQPLGIVNVGVVGTGVPFTANAGTPPQEYARIAGCPASPIVLAVESGPGLLQLEANDCELNV
jgi:hypothetical protein